MPSNFSPNLTVRKPVIRSAHGVVAAQHVGAARVGARVLADGGNAVDAAVAVSFALGVLEPWMSGIGGGGMMVVRHPYGDVHAVDFGMRAPAALEPADYPLTGGVTQDLFAWPAVEADRNLTGPLAVAVPGLVDGVGVAHEAWGRCSWADLVAPSVALARRGLSVDWYATYMIAQAARRLAADTNSAKWFLPRGHPPPVPMAPGEETFLPAPGLADTLHQIMREGSRSFYEGAVAETIARDAKAVGSRLSAGDLGAYQARIVDPLSIRYRGADIWATPELTAGPTLAQTLREMEEGFTPGGAPDSASFHATAEALGNAYTRRLAEMGDMDGHRDIGCTSHLSVVDRDGMIVSLTQTLLSVFGSAVTLPETGILMNNGIYWFDPRSGKPNTLKARARCLSNMCPVVARRGDGTLFGIGASGGRRILPSVTQMVSFLTDFEMDLEAALHHPRIDASGGDLVVADSGLSDEVINTLEGRFTTQLAKRTVNPSWFANISAVCHDEHGSAGGVEPWLPWGDACAAD